MIPNPFAKRRSAQELAANQRRSTRVDYVCPVVVSGRDATGQAFRDETETSIVNLHGCKLKINHGVLVGMVVTLETPHAGPPAKAICVHVWDPSQGQTQHDIAVQLLRPRNIWGLQNPPADWQDIAGALVKGASSQPVGNAPVASSSRPATSAPVATPKGTPAAGSKSAPAVAKPAPSPAAPAANPSAPPARIAKPAAWPAAAPAAVPGAPASKPGSGVPAASKVSASSAPAASTASPARAGSLAGEKHLTELEERSWQLMDSVLQTLRDQTEELVRDTLEEFRQQVGVLVKDAEEGLKQRAEQSYGDVESSINTLRRDIAEQLTQRTQEIVESAKEALQKRVAEMFSTMLNSSQGKPPKPPSK